MDGRWLVDELAYLIARGDVAAFDTWLTALSSTDRQLLGNAVEARVAPRMPEGGNHPKVSEPRVLLCARAVLALAPTGSMAADRMFWRAVAIDPVVLLATVVSRGNQWAEQFFHAALSAESSFPWDRREVPVLCLPLILHLGIRPPVTPGLIQAWGEYYRMSVAKWDGTFVERRTTQGFTQPWISADGDIQVRDYRAEGLDFTAVCRLDPLFAQVAPHLVSRPLFGPHEDLRPVAQLPPVLAALVDEGVVARDEAVDEALTRLARNPRASEQQYLANVLRALQIGPADLADRHALALSIISAGHGSASAVILGPLLESDLADEDLEELAFVVFARKEKKQRTQLMSYLARAVKAATAEQSAARATTSVHARETLVTALGAATELDDLRVSQRAAELLGQLSGGAQPVRSGASGLDLLDLWNSLPPASPVGRQPLFGAGVEAFTAAFSAVEARPGAAGEEALLACYVASVPRHRREIGKFFAGLRRERAFDAGLVSRALLDRFRWSQADHEQLIRELLETLPMPGEPRSRSSRWTGLTPAGALLMARLSEAQLLARHVPCLLSTPSLENGVVTVEDLVGRLRAYSSARARYGELDLLLALLRLEPVPAERATELTGFAVPRATEPRDTRLDGVALAHAWVARGGLPPLRSALWEGPPVPDPYGRDMGRIHGTPTVVRVSGPAVTLPVHPSYFPSAPPTLFLGVGDSERHVVTTWNLTADLAASAVPSWRDLSAAYWLESHRAHSKDGPRLLGQVARCTGAGGPATHLALAHGLSAPAPDSRQRAVDAALEIAGRGAFSAEHLREATLALQRTGELTPGRFAAACEQIALAGALGAVWPALSAVATALMAEAKVRTGTADVLAILRRHCAAVPPEERHVEGLENFVGRRGSSKALTEARALLAVLGDLGRAGVLVNAGLATVPNVPPGAAS
ncbi:hypothetical protein KZX45_00010 [Georgenia sp. EYE_87]|uniref:hypothetical protein n=1 Tax=Georgenia sp. EYE_87 TaxID=2853448 RepID=UPI00200557FE|nr:hypothetical protein [Georgenia sp. EYE_87]MCK6208927.1 hypothetical protein [Georgenia sp. EYE_87]